jgi:hypothetical protein
MPEYRVAVLMPIAHENKCRENLPLWADRGYDLLLFQDKYRFAVDFANPKGDRLVDLVMVGNEYIGWPKSINWLVQRQLQLGPTRCPDVFIAAGDDMRPDPRRTAQEMAERYLSRFPNGEGIMQPIGDDWSDSQGLIAARICGSPIFGRAWASQAYNGAGPLCPEYHNFYADEELQNVAMRAGVLWQDMDTMHYHDHWSRRGDPRTATEFRTQDWWDDDKATFERRRAAGFPNSAPDRVALA